MAVYTEVAFDDLEAFLADYDIGEARSFKGIAEGVENSNFLLQTTRGTILSRCMRSASARTTCPSSSGCSAISRGAASPARFPCTANRARPGAC